MAQDAGFDSLGGRLQPPPRSSLTSIVCPARMSNLSNIVRSTTRMFACTYPVSTLYLPCSSALYQWLRSQLRHASFLQAENASGFQQPDTTMMQDSPAYFHSTLYSSCAPCYCCHTWEEVLLELLQAAYHCSIALLYMLGANKLLSSVDLRRPQILLVCSISDLTSPSSSVPPQQHSQAGIVLCR